MINFKQIWQHIRELSGDDAYERYLQHCAQHHRHETVVDKDDVSPPFSREMFFKEWQEKKWKGVKRCC